MSATNDIIGIAAAVAKSVPGTAGATAVAAQLAAEAAADHCDDVLESIPEDYSTLSSDVSDLKSAVAYKDSTYPDLTSGNAEQLLSTTGVTDKVPYTFRQSGGNGADREIDKIVGGTVCWNQLVYSLNSANEVYGIKREAAGTGALRVYGTSTNTTNFTVATLKDGVATISGHVYYATLGNITLPTGTKLSFTNTDKKTDFLGYLGNSLISFGIIIDSGTQIDVTITPAWFDLTAMFGSTIADYVYALETATAGAGIALLKSWGFFTKPYYAYNAGELMSVQAASHKTVGFNQWDGVTEGGIIYNGVESANNSYWRTKNYIPVIPNMTYFIQGRSNDGQITLYDSNKNYVQSISQMGAGTNYLVTIPSNVAYMRFYQPNTKSPDELCINLSCSRDGEYQPYVKHSYPLDNDLTLRGIPKLDANNSLYYDGDVYESDGTVTRRYGIVDLGTLNWQSDSNNFWYAIEVVLTSDNIAVRVNAISNKLTYGGLKSSAETGGTDKFYSSGAGYLEVYGGEGATKAQVKERLNGTLLVYKLATPTTETADPYKSPQIVDPYGTEEYVDAGVVAETRDVSIPVGHETFYPENLRSKIEGLPFNFATLIAPTEASYKATQAYSSGDLFIVNNILYKATASIANEATITPGTNCTATTLAAVIAALA